MKTYDPGQVSVTFGPIILSGFGDGEQIMVEPNVESFTLLMGAQGEGARTRSRDKSARVTVRILQTSETNDLLSAVQNLDRAAGEGIFPLMVKDNGGRSLFLAESAWIVAPPSSPFGSEAGVREWIFETDSMESLIAGN